MMGDRATLERIFAIMRRILLVPMDGVNPIPRKGTTRHECYRALYEIQELLETRRCFGMHLPQTNGDRIRAKTDDELAEMISRHIDCDLCPVRKKDRIGFCRAKDCKEAIVEWLKEEVE